MTGLWVDGQPRPDHGPGMVQRTCRCGAGWVGMPDDGCEWCARRVERQRADERRLLLDPPWLRSDVGDVRYDELDEIDKSVWDRTRAHQRGADSLEQWARRLARAVASGLMTRREADAALTRMERGRA